jgi:beta-N-acetylhexosaminidase
MAAFLNRMQRMARVPLIVGGDFERGASMRVNDTIKYPHLMAYGAAGDPALTRALGAATAQEARALGVHWVFAPVSDVNNNPENPIINIRSFGEDPKLVSEHVRAFIEGAHSDPKHKVLLAAKHFPGHGDTATDSHMGLATIGADRARMDAVELAPFHAAIAAGVDSVMTAHISVPALEPREIPATVSEPVLTGLLRKEMGFAGLIVTDAMDMQGLSQQFSSGEASVRAVEAGADVLLMPPDPEAAVSAIVRAVQSGRLSRQRIRASALRVLAAKARVGLHRSKLVDLDEIVEQLDSPESAAAAQLAAERAVTLVKNESSALPVREPENACLFVLSENRYGQQGRAMIAEARRLAPKMPAVLLDPLVSATEIGEILEKHKGCAKPVVAAFVSVGAYRGNVALAGNFTPLLDGLIASGKPVTLIALGSPYLLRTFPKVSAYLATFSTAAPSESAAVRAVLGESAITGKLPVSIPGIAQPGDGIALTASSR